MSQPPASVPAALSTVAFSSQHQDQGELAVELRERDESQDPSGPSMCMVTPYGCSRKLKVEDQREFVRYWNVFKGALGEHVRGANPAAPVITALAINWTDEYVEYMDPASNQLKRIPLSELQRDPGFTDVIPRLRSIGRMAWGGEMTPYHYSPKGIGPKDAPAPLLEPSDHLFQSSSKDENWKEVFKIMRQNNIHVDDETFLKMAQAMLIKEALAEKVKRRIAAVKTRLVDATTPEDVKTRLKEQLKKLQALQAELAQEWEMTALPFVLAYQANTAGGSDKRAERIQAAEKLYEHLNKHYNDKRKEKWRGWSQSASTWWKGPYQSVKSEWGADVAGLLVAASPPKGADGRTNHTSAGIDYSARKDFRDFAVVHGSLSPQGDRFSTVKSETFAHALARYLVDRGGTMPTDFANQFVTEYLGDSLAVGERGELELLPAVLNDGRLDITQARADHLSHLYVDNPARTSFPRVDAPAVAVGGAAPLPPPDRSIPPPSRPVTPVPQESDDDIDPYDLL